MNKYITTYLEDIVKNRISDDLTGVKERIKEEHQKMIKNINDKKISIYGVTTQVGHMDNKKVLLEDTLLFQYHLIDNHNLVVANDYDTFFTNCILYTKVKQLSNGFTGVSPKLFERLVKMLEDTQYHISIPKNSSYSCGDVIPAAAFAKSVIEYSDNSNFKLSSKDGMILINGSYITTGHSLAVVGILRILINKFLRNTLRIFEIGKFENSMMEESFYDKNSNLFAICSFLKDNLDEVRKDIQEPISIRSTPQTIEAMISSLFSLEEVVHSLMTNPSDNPFILEDKAYSQCSFFSPVLTLELDKASNMLLYTAWIIERRIHYLLSGKIPHIPLNGHADKNNLGAIQIPKLITSILEDLRLENGRKSFASGGSTSYGIEDSWTLSLKLSERLEAMIYKINGMLNIEEYLFIYLQTKDYKLFKNQIKNVLSKERSLHADISKYGSEIHHSLLDDIEEYL